MMSDINLPLMIGGACGAGGYMLDESKWAIRTLPDIGPVRIRNRSKSNMDGLFVGQLLFGITGDGELIGIDVAEGRKLVPRKQFNRENN